MDRKNLQHIEMFTRVVEFGATHVDVFPKSTFAGQSFAALGSAVSNLSQQTSLLVSIRQAVQASTRVRTQAREALRKQLQRISDTAAAIGIDRPGLEGKFRMPENRDQALIHGGKAFLDDVESLKKEFMQHHLPVENLNSAVVDLEAAVSRQASCRDKRAQAAKAADDALGECLKLPQRVDAVVGNMIADNQPLMAAWTNTRRVRRGPTRPAPSEPEPASAPPA